MQESTFYLINSGCRLNQYEADSLAAGLEFEGFASAPSPEEAEYVIYNTCTVTNRADSRSRSAIRRLHQMNPGAKIIVTGCYATTDAEEVSELPGVHSVIPNEEKAKIPERLAGINRHTNGLFGYRVRTAQGKSRAYLKIQDGCNRTCSYCKIPQARGVGRSRPFAEILEEARELLRLGFRELVITGVNIGWYQDETKDIYGLLHALLELQGDYYIRLSSIEPGEVNEKLAEVMIHPRMAHFLHVPLQSGSKEILKIMRRGYTAEHFARKIHIIREAVPEIHIGTDLIVGFPGETDELFEETMDFMSQMKFANIHVFPFSLRRGTPVEKAMKKDPEAFVSIPKSEVRKRIARVIQLKERHTQEYIELTAGSLVRGIVEKESKENLAGEILTENYVRVKADTRGIGRGEKVLLSYRPDLTGELHATETANVSQ